MLLPAEIYTRNKNFILLYMWHNTDPGVSLPTPNEAMHLNALQEFSFLTTKQEVGATSCPSSVLQVETRSVGRPVIHNKIARQRQKVCTHCPAARSLPAWSSPHLNGESAGPQEMVCNVSLGHTTEHLMTSSVILAVPNAGGPDRSELFISYAWFCFVDWNNLMKCN